MTEMFHSVYPNTVTGKHYNLASASILHLESWQAEDNELRLTTTVCALFAKCRTEQSHLSRIIFVKEFYSGS